MFVLVRACEGLLVAHAYLFVSFVLGAAVLPWLDGEAYKNITAASIMTRVVATTALGLVIIGFTALALGFLHCLWPSTFVTALAAEFAVASGWQRRDVFSAVYWAHRVHVLGKCWNGGLIATYYSLLILSVPAVIGNIGGSDPVGYHLLYAKEWANAGSLTIDPFLRLPFYASNFLLFFTIAMSFGGDAFVNYVAWMPCLLAALGMCASVIVALEARIGTVYASCIGFCLTLAVFLAPSNLRWLPTAYIDAPIGAFAFLVLLCLLLAIHEKKITWLACGAVVAGFLMGMKGSFLLLVPVYLIALTIVARYTRTNLRTAAAVLVLFLVTASPWYVRNLVLAGDPIPPVINIAVHGSDGLMTKGEWALNSADLKTDKTATAVAQLPVRAFFDAISLREYGTTAIILVTYVPLVVIVVLFGLGRRINPPLIVTAYLLLASFGYWAFTSAWLRYDTIFYFFLPTTVALLLAELPATAAATGIAVFAALILMLPSPGTREFFQQTFDRNYRYIAGSYTSDASLANYGEGYAEAQYAANVFRRERLTGRVFMVGTRVGYYLYQKGIDAVGDWMGPAGWMRLYRAVDAGRAADFMDALGVDEVLMDPNRVVGGLSVPLGRQLQAHGYCARKIPNSSQLIFVKTASCAHTTED
jgi:hypothetical protein